jgi:hypothetical protein
MAADKVRLFIHSLPSVLFAYFRRQADSVCSEGHSSRSASPEMYSLPPPDMQLIIDKMASYVAKNGRDFEAIVKSKGKGKSSVLQRLIYHSLEPETARIVNTSTDYAELELTAIHPAGIVFPLNNVGH